MMYLQWTRRAREIPEYSVLAEDIRSSGRCRRVTLVLLCLLAHAILVTVTHHHKLRPDAPAQPSAVLEAGGASMPVGWGGPGGDSGCLSRSLQRHLLSDPRPFRL